MLVIGLDPRRVPGDWDPEPVVRAIGVGLDAFASRGMHVEACLLGLDGSDDLAAVLTAALRRRAWRCVVVGGGLRHSDDELAVLELAVNLIRRHAPDATIAFSTTPTSMADAAARWVDPAAEPEPS